MDGDNLLFVVRGLYAVVDAELGPPSKKRFRRRSETLTAVLFKT